MSGFLCPTFNILVLKNKKYIFINKGDKSMAVLEKKNTYDLQHSPYARTDAGVLERRQAKRT